MNAVAAKLEHVALPKTPSPTKGDNGDVMREDVMSMIPKDPLLSSDVTTSTPPPNRPTVNIQPPTELSTPAGSTDAQPPTQLDTRDYVPAMATPCRGLGKSNADWRSLRRVTTIQASHKPAQVMKDELFTSEHHDHDVFSLTNTQRDADISNSSQDE